MTSEKEEEVIRHYASTYCTIMEICKLFNTDCKMAHKLTNESIKRIKARRRMELMIESGAEWNPENNLAN